MKSLLLFLIGTFFTGISQAKIIQVLYIGNSYIYTNNLPDMIQQMGYAGGDTISYTAHTPGGATAMAHWNNTTVHTLISQGGWDYVVIQCQSQEPSFPPAQVATDTYPYVHQLDSLVQATNTCGETVFFMTWGYVNGDPSNCNSYPILCTYDGQQQRLRESYLLFAQDFNANVAPVGAAWKRVRDQQPGLNLYSTDGSHPGIAGSYLAACVFYTTFFIKSSVGNSYVPSGITNGDANILQTIASQTVLDSLDNWQGSGNLPYADFDKSINGLNVSFTNQAKRYTQLDWDFGDGTTSNAINLVHNYTNSGNYAVCLRASNTCKSHEMCQNISLNPNSVEDHKLHSYYVVKGHTVCLLSPEKDIPFSLYDLQGQKLCSFKLNATRSKYELPIRATGIYLLRAEYDEQSTVHKLILP